MNWIVTVMPSQEELELGVIEISSPTANVFEVEWDCSSSVVETLLAVPPRAVEFIFVVSVQVPLVHLVVTLVIVPAYGRFKKTRISPSETDAT